MCANPWDHRSLSLGKFGRMRDHLGGFRWFSGHHVFFCSTEDYSQSSSFAETSSSYPPFKRNSRLFSSLSRRTRGLGVLGLLSPFTGFFAKITKVKKATYNAHDTLFTFGRVYRHAQFDAKGHCNFGDSRTNESAIQRYYL